MFSILFIVFIGAIGIAMPYPIIAPLFLNPQHGDIVPFLWGTNARSVFLGLTLAVYPFGQFLASAVLGAYSDRLGRKRILIISIMGMTIGYLISALTLEINNLIGFIFARFLTGLMEGNIAMARAMATDLPHIDKLKAFSRINAVSATGAIFGPLIGGVLADQYLVSWFSYAIPFYFAAMLSLLSLAFVLLYFPEVPAQNHVSSSMLQEFNLARRLRHLFRNKSLKSILIICSIFTLSIDVFYKFGVVYLVGNWKMPPSIISLYGVGLSISVVFTGVWLANYLGKKFLAIKIISFSIFISALCFLILFFLKSKIIAFFIFMVIGVTSALAIINMTVALSETIDKSLQGELMGTQASLRMLGNAIISLIGGVLIIQSIDIPMLFGALVAALAFFLWVYRTLIQKAQDM